MRLSERFLDKWVDSDERYCGQSELAKEPVQIT